MILFEVLDKGRMKGFVLVLSVAFMATVYAANSNDKAKDGSWTYEIGGSDNVVGYRESSRTLSFYNRKMGIDVTFDGTEGFFNLINSTSGATLIVDPRTGISKLGVASNKKKLLEAFASNNNDNIFDEAAKATVGNGIIFQGQNTSNVYNLLAGLFTKRDNNHVVAMHGKTDLLLNIRKEYYLLRATIITFIETNPFYTVNGALLLWGGAWGVPHIPLYDFHNLLTTMVTYLNGKFNPDLMAKVGSLIEAGQKENFKKDIFNSLCASISLVAPYTVGLDLQVAAALNIAY